MDSTRALVKVFGSQPQAFVAVTTRMVGPIEIKQKCGMTSVGYINEPRSRAKSETRLINELYELTQQDAMPNFCGIEHDSPHAISMGVTRREQTRKIILTTWGTKVAIVKKMLNHDMKSDVPITYSLATHGINLLGTNMQF